MKLEEYMRELILMKKQYGTEEELYPLINMLVRENDNVRNLSVRTVAAGRRGKEENKGNMLFGYASFPDIAILDEGYDPQNTEDVRGEIKKMYGCVEAKQLPEDEKGNLIIFNQSEESKKTNKIKLKIQYEDALIIAEKPEGNINKKAMYYAKCENKENSEINIEKHIKNYRNYRLFNNEVLDEFEKKYRLKWYDCKTGNYTKKCLTERMGKPDDLTGEKYLRVVRSIIWEGNDNNSDLTQLIGELLWYGKVLYTNGIVWYYLEVNKEEIMKNLFKPCFEDGKDWIKQLADKNENIQFSCTPIGNLSFAKTKIKDKPDEIRKKFYLRDGDTYNGEREWARLKYNLASINWEGTNTPKQFILETDNMTNIPET